MKLTRRTILKSMGTLPLLTGGLSLPAWGQAAPAGADLPPVLFVHGNGDHAALWMTTL